METKTIPTVLAVVVVIGGVFLLARTPAPQSSREVATTTQEIGNSIVSSAGIHWHPELTVMIKGEKQVVPNNIGMGMQFAGYPQYDPMMMMMTNMHTHDDSGQIHWEVMEGPVTKEDVRLSQFFAVWGKKFTNSCIFDYCNGLQGRLAFKVNGQDNPDFENYLVKDKDKIEIIFQ